MKSKNKYDQGTFLEELRRRKHVQPDWSKRRRIDWIQNLRWSSRLYMSASTRQLATLIRADVPLVRALELVASQAGHGRIQSCYAHIAKKVRTGVSFAVALASSPSIFDTLFVKMVEVGEQAGLLGEVLERLAIHQEQTEVLRRKVQGALLYPAVIMLVAAGATLVLLTEVIPLFAEMFQQSKVALPGPTRLVIQLSAVLKNYGIFILIMISSGIVVMRNLMKHSKGQILVGRMKMYLPVIGAVTSCGAFARFTRNLGTLLASGVPLLQALTATHGTLMNPFLEQSIAKAGKAISQGQSLRSALSDAKGWPALMIHMIGVGEETGRLDTVMQHMADYYALETDRHIQTLTSVLEPLLIVLVALLVGGILIAMYLPIFNLSDVVV